jgi:cyanophycin synthetase
MSRFERHRGLLVRLDLALVTGLRDAWQGWRRDVDFARRAPEGRQSASRSMWQEAADAVGGTIDYLSPQFAEIRRRGARTRVMGETTALNDVVAVALAEDKPVAHKLLAAAGLPTPQHVVVDAWSAALDFLTQTGGPCIVKPARGSGGDGVTGEVRRPAQLRRAALHARRYDGCVLVERQIRGDVYRVLVLDGEVVDVVRRRPPRVYGDGRSKIAELIATEYGRRLDVAQASVVKPFVVDLDCVFTLEAAGLTPQHVLPRGRSAIVKTVSNYNSERENETIAPSGFRGFGAEAAAAAEVLGLRLAGVDVVSVQPDTSLAAGSGVILEVNGRPALHHHKRVADRAHATPVAARLLEALLAEGG